MSLLPFATLAQLPQLLAAIAQGRTFRLTKGDLTAEVVTHVRKLSCLILSFSSKTLQSDDNIMKLQTKGEKRLTDYTFSEILCHKMPSG